MQLMPIVEGLILVLVANGAPLVAHKIFGAWGAFPVDFGALFFDGAPVLGPSKTIRGILSSLVATSLAAALIGLTWPVGTLAAGAAMAGDLLSSFVKRRVGLPAQSMAPGLDQTPESFLPLLACKAALGLTLSDVLFATALFWLSELMLSRALFSLKIRERPY